MSGVFKSIKPSQIRLNPFKAFKKWYGDSGSLYARYEGVLVQDLTQLATPFPQSTNTTTNGKLKGSVYQSVDHLFYRDYYTNTKATFGSGNAVLQNRQLYDFVTVLSLPQPKTGEEILAGSVKLKYKGLLSGSTANGFFPSGAAVVDDSNGNLVYWTNMDATGSVTTYYDISGSSIGLPNFFGNTTSLKQISSGKHMYRLETERFTKKINTNIASQSVDTWRTSAPTTTTIRNITPATTARGIGFKFVSGSWVKINPSTAEVNNLYNFINKDYNIGFYATVNQGNTSGLFLEKRTTASFVGTDVYGNTISTTTVANRYPYKVSYVATSTYWTLVFEKSVNKENGQATSGQVATQLYYRVEVTGLSLNTAYYISISRIGKVYHVSATQVGAYPNQNNAFPNVIKRNPQIVDLISNDTYCANDGALYIGTSVDGGGWSSNMTMEGLSIYSEGFTSGSAQHYFQLASNGTNNLNVGNVFYSQGLLALTNPSTYERSTPYTNIYPQELEYRSTQTIFETEVNCTIGPGEYNYTSNLTAQKYDPTIDQYRLKDFITASNFTPYVTQIGLYDDYGNLLVAGKLSQPLRPPGNVDTTFVVKFDR